MSEAESLAAQGNSQPESSKLDPAPATAPPATASESTPSEPVSAQPPGNSTAIVALPPKQVLAFDGMKKGYGIVKSAKLAGVDRSTLRRWIRKDPKFKAVYNEWEEEQLFNVHATLVAGAPAAARRLIKSARKDDRAATTVLKSVGAFKRQQPGSVDVDEVRQEKLLAEQERRLKLEDREEKMLETHIKHAFARSERDKAIAHREERDKWKAMEAKALPAPPEAKALPAPNPEAKAQCDALISQLQDLTALITDDPKTPQDAAPPGGAAPAPDAAPPEPTPAQPVSESPPPQSSE